MKRAIVTGASGFIGSYLVKELLATGYEVLAAVHHMRDFGELFGGPTERLQMVSCEGPHYDGIHRYAQGDYDFFFHLAWAGVSGAMSCDLMTQQENIEGAVSALRMAKELNCKRFIGAGSLHEIECGMEMEFPRAIYHYNNYYKTAKLAAHYYCKLEAARLGIDFLWPRLTNTYGAGEVSARLVNSTIRELLAGERPAFTKGDQLYNFIYVTDVAAAYRLLAERGNSFGAYMISSEDIRPLKDFLLEIRAFTAPDAEMGFGELPYDGVYLKKSDLFTPQLAEDTGFRTAVPFKAGIEKTVDFVKTVCPQFQLSK